jgi:beta-xylosidase
VDFWNAAGDEQTFRIHPVRASSPFNHKWNSPNPCADPFAWYDNSTQQFKLICTSTLLDVSSTPTMNPEVDFKYLGHALTGNNFPPWAQSGIRWAPENIPVMVQGKVFNVIFWSNYVNSDRTHRIGWVSSAVGAIPGKWDNFSPNFMNLGMAPGGDIDAHVFFDMGANTHYLVWKTDDNNVGISYTRIWAVKISFSVGAQLQVHIEGTPVQILDSKGLWWSVSWYAPFSSKIYLPSPVRVSGGSLIEGPEIIKQGDYYYLFFASGRYCEDTYMEGVARSRNVFGPYEKMAIPILSTGLVGNSNGKKLLGPGHASVVNNRVGEWDLVWHASTGADSACQRYPFVSNVKFTGDGWPYVDF